MLFKNKYKIESARLKGYDYSSPGAYLITIDTVKNYNVFGVIEKGGMVLNENGKIASGKWKKIPVHFPYVITDEYAVMPEQILGIILLDEFKSLQKREPLGTIIDHFKRECKTEISKSEMNFKWHPGYNIQIIRNENELNSIRERLIDYADSEKL